MGNIDLHIASGNGLGLVEQFIERVYGLSYGPAAERNDDKESYNEQGYDDIGETVVGGEYITVRTYDGQAPRSAWHRFIADKARHTVDDRIHAPLITRRHFMAKGYEVGLPSRVGTTEDCLCEELRRVRMNKVASLVVDHHEIGVGIGLLNRHELREMEQGKVGRDDANETVVSIVERSAIGGNHTVDGQLQ